MAYKVSKNVVAVPVSKIIIDWKRDNVREEEQRDRVPSMKRDMAFRGQQDPAMLEALADGTYRPVKGFIRSTAISELAAEKVIDPTTGKPFESVRAFVVTDLNERERVSLMLDHSQRTSLTKVGLFNSFERAFNAGYTEAEIVAMLYDLLAQHYPPTRPIKKREEDKGRDQLDYYRGVVQSMKQAWLAPILLHDAWVDKLAGKQKWPTKAEMVELSVIHQKEAAADKTMKISRTNPGPKFMEGWSKLLKAQEEGAESGTSRPKAVSMMNRQKLEEVHKVLDSVTLKIAYAIVRRDVSEDKLMVLDKLLVDAESRMGPEWHAALAGLLASEEAPAKAEEPKAEEPKAEESAPDTK